MPKNPIALASWPPALELLEHPGDLLAASDDAELVQWAQQGEAAAFSELVRRHAPAVQRRALAIVHNAEDAQDVAQDALLVAWQRLGGFRGDCAFGSWIYVIVTRLALNRAVRRRPSVPLDERTPTADRGLDPALATESAAVGAMLRQAVEELPPPQARAVALHHVDGLSYDEIARLTHSTVPAVRSHIYRGRRRLLGALSSWT